MTNKFSVNSGWIKSKEEERKKIEQDTKEFLKNKNIKEINNGETSDLVNGSTKYTKEKIREFHSRIVSNPKPIVF